MTVTCADLRKTSIGKVDSMGGSQRSQNFAESLRVEMVGVQRKFFSVSLHASNARYGTAPS
ncbi:hypothetical protein FIBSPDRAFT_880559 [Athelia psychrophila]|uniref:Uncharacterized protein n=1 Tax=Athelia psychrophila TaxID=1759441 RepID=A0A167SPK6_9AGAM|nr:hypothetical protein FIBSPDRAFT_880559 [Fibularhizoctonia sp. CBS 109695]